MKTDSIDEDERDALDQEIREENFTWLERILNLYRYLGEHIPAIDTENPSYFFREPGFMRDIEISPDGSEGASHSPPIYQDGSQTIHRKPKMLSPEQLKNKLIALHADLLKRALQKTEKDILRDLATKKLEDAGIY